MRTWVTWLGNCLGKLRDAWKGFLVSLKKKRVSYIPAVDSAGDLPDAASFEAGVAFYVKGLMALVATNGSVWTVITGTDTGLVVG